MYIYRGLRYEHISTNLLLTYMYTVWKNTQIHHYQILENHNMFCLKDIQLQFDQDWGCTRHTDQRDQLGAFNLHIYHNQIIKTWRNLSE